MYGVLLGLKVICETFYRRFVSSFGENQFKNPVSTLSYLYIIYNFCIVNIVGPTVCDVIAAHIILSRVMIKPDYTLLENNDTD